MQGLLYRLRGVRSWPETQACATQVEELTRGGRGGDWNRVLFTYKPAQETQDGSLKVDSYSSLFNLAPGDTFPIRYDPAHLGRFYVEEAQSVFSTVHYVILGVGAAFAAALAFVQIFGR